MEWTEYSGQDTYLTNTYQIGSPEPCTAELNLISITVYVPCTASSKYICIWMHIYICIHIYVYIHKYTYIIVWALIVWANRKSSIECDDIFHWELNYLCHLSLMAHTISWPWRAYSYYNDYFQIIWVSFSSRIIVSDLLSLQYWLNYTLGESLWNWDQVHSFTINPERVKLVKFDLVILHWMLPSFLYIITYIYEIEDWWHVLHE